jgi:hypothetical protein
MLDPSPLLGVYRFEIGSTTTVIGRRGINVAARRRSGFHAHEFGPLSETLALIVDEERGVLLRQGVIVEGEEISFSEVIEIAFDEPVPPELFHALR